MRKIILLVDNEPEYLETATEFLKQAGFTVVPATNPTEAGNVLDHGNVDLAILDNRLLDDTDDKDFSGLEAARVHALGVPKIILTNWPTYRLAREALGAQLDGLPVAVDFVAKKEGLPALLTAIRKTLHISRFQELADGLSEQVTVYYDEARQQANQYFRATFTGVIVGIVIVFAGAILAMLGAVMVGSLIAIAGVIADAIGLLFFRRADAANVRVDQCRGELLAIRQFEQLLTACDEFLTEEMKADSRAKVIEAASKHWLAEPRTSSSPPARLPSRPTHT